MQIKCNIIDKDSALEQFFLQQDFNKKNLNNVKKYFQELQKNINLILKNIVEQYECFKNKTIEINLLFANDAFMQNLNKQYRNKDSITDVLSFQSYIIDANLLLNSSTYINEIASYINLGDIAICLNKLYENSKNNKINFHLHLYYMFVHSFLHLLGFEHEEEQDYIKMELEQNKIMNIINKKIIAHKFPC